MRHFCLLLVVALLSVGLPLGSKPARAGSFMVTNTRDSAPGSLRQALTAANSSGGPDTVAFDIPASDRGYAPADGVWTIELKNTLTSASMPTAGPPRAAAGASASLAAPAATSSPTT